MDSYDPETGVICMMTRLSGETELELVGKGVAPWPLAPLRAQGSTGGGVMKVKDFARQKYAELFKMAQEGYAKEGRGFLMAREVTACGTGIASRKKPARPSHRRAHRSPRSLTNQLLLPYREACGFSLSSRSLLARACRSKTKSSLLTSISKGWILLGINA